MKSKSVDMVSGPMFKGLLALTIPIMIMNVAQSLFNLLDMAVLRVFGFEQAVGAVGACGVLITLFTSLLIGISAGANVVIARHIGAGNKSRAEAAINTSIIFAICAGLTLMVIGVVFARDFLLMTKCPTTLLDDATLYFQIYFYGLPIQMLYVFSASVLRALGDTKRPMYFLLLGSACKVVLTVLLLQTALGGVISASLATVFANLVACVMSIVAVVKNKDVEVLRIKKLGFDFTELKAILYNGVPAGIQSALYAFANVIITTVVNSYGEAATTGVSIANQFDGILYQISLAPSLAAIPYVAQNMGAGKFDRVKKATLYSIAITVAFGASLGSLSAIFSRELSYIGSSSPEVVAFSVQKMVIVSSTYFICGINEVLGGALKGMGRPIVPTVTSLIFLCLLRFAWVYFVFPLFPPNNLTFLYLVWPIGWTLSIITLSCVLIYAMSKYRKTNNRTEGLSQSGITE